MFWKSPKNKLEENSDVDSRIVYEYKMFVDIEHYLVAVGVSLTAFFVAVLGVLVKGRCV